MYAKRTGRVVGGWLIVLVLTLSAGAEQPVGTGVAEYPVSDAVIMVTDEGMRQPGPMDANEAEARANLAAREEEAAAARGSAALPIALAVIGLLTIAAAGAIAWSKRSGKGAV